MDDVAKASSRWHEHGVDVKFAEEWGWSIDGGRDVDFGVLVKLTLMTGLNVPLDVAFEIWPPDTIKQGVARRIEALMAEAVVSVAYQGQALLRHDVQLMSPLILFVPEPVIEKSKAVRSPDELGDCQATEIRGWSSRAKILVDARHFIISMDSC